MGQEKGQVPFRWHRSSFSTCVPLSVTSGRFPDRLQTMECKRLRHSVLRHPEQRWIRVAPFSLFRIESDGLDFLPNHRICLGHGLVSHPPGRESEFVVSAGNSVSVKHQPAKGDASPQSSFFMKIRSRTLPTRTAETPATTFPPIDFIWSSVQPIPREERGFTR